MIARALRRSTIRSLQDACVFQRAVVLTYDDGPGPVCTPHILRILADASVAATFFLLGARAETAPEIVDATAAAGHELACHSYRHLNAWKCLPRAACRDIDQGYSALARWVGQDAMFRPPYGRWTPWTASALARRGARTGWWTIDSSDTSRILPTTPSVGECLARMGGGVVLMHDFDRQGPDAQQRLDYVSLCTLQCLTVARQEGLQVLTLGRLLDVATRCQPSESRP